MIIELWHYPFMFALGFLASFVNSFAGGGSAIALPLMIFSGMPPTLANGTNRFGILWGNVGSVSGLHKKGYFNKEIFKKVVVWVVLGAVLGAFLGVQISDQVFQICLATVLIAVVFFGRIKKDVVVSEKELVVTWKVALVFFLIGFYGGFIQVGIGFVLILAFLKFTGLDLVRVNALKGSMAIVFILISVIIFSIGGKIIWALAIAQACGAWFGGRIGSKIQIKKGGEFISKVISVVSIALAIKLLYDVLK